ncbi:PREDICTED: putative uncharacterized protein DDB_G0282499 [Polistes canadensis]|uniref:putative uncharacterized protein DDB_G0282499 n=1 Tax=Polistes canadensis TaxID=91411 RepID=UPI000718DAF1|nr:PREDICTED: putative uncharacterized protein DDB_G0282499 [Polistes canadensis]
MQHQKRISHDQLDLQKNYISSSLKQSYKSRRLMDKNQIKSLTFPNTINSLDSKYYSQKKIINYYKESFPISTLELCNNEQQNQKAHKKPSDKAQSSTNKNTLLDKNKNALHKSKMSLPMTPNIFQEKERTNINYIKSVISNLNHIENKNLPKTAELMFLKMNSNNNKDLLIPPMYQSFFCNFITPGLHSNNNRKEDVRVKNKLYTSYSEHMVKIVNYENETQLLQMYYPKVCNLNYSIEEKKGIKRSMSAIQYNKSTQCISNIKTSNSNLHMAQNKFNNLQNNSYKVLYSLENINRTSMPEKSACLIRACQVEENKRYMEAEYDCKIKYSWQIIGTSSQTSKVLLDNILEENQSPFSNNNNNNKCEIKYSWQIIGTGTQVALENNNDADYWSGVIFSPNIHRYENTVIDENNKKTYNYNGLCEKQACRKKCLILNNQYTQTLAEKKIQTDVLDCKAKYSWQNLVSQHL